MLGNYKLYTFPPTSPFLCEEFCCSYSVASKVFSDRDLFLGHLISNYRSRIGLPEESISIIETDLLGLGRESLLTDTESPNSTNYVIEATEFGRKAD